METELEYILTHTYKSEMIAYMDAHPEAFEEAIQLSLLDKQPYSWRAAWLLWSCMDDNDPRIQKFLDKIIDSLPTKQDNQRRDLMAILGRMELDKDSEGRLYDISVEVWQRIDKIPSVRYSALIMIVKIAKKYPELFHEVDLLVQGPYLDGLSEPVKKSILKRFKKLKSEINR